MSHSRIDFALHVDLMKILDIYRHIDIKFFCRPICALSEVCSVLDNEKGTQWGSIKTPPRLKLTECDGWSPDPLRFTSNILLRYCSTASTIPSRAGEIKCNLEHSLAFSINSGKETARRWVHELPFFHSFFLTKRHEVVMQFEGRCIACTGQDDILTKACSVSAIKLWRNFIWKI